MSVVVTVTLVLPGRSRRDALNKASEKLYRAAWGRYPDAIQSAVNDGGIGYRRELVAECDLIESLSRQLGDPQA